MSTPGPWDIARQQRAQRAPEPAPARRPAVPAEARGQSPFWALVSTALRAGLLWRLGGWIIALAGVIGVFVHEFGHVLVMNRVGMGPARIVIVPFFGGAAVPSRAEPTEYKGLLVSLSGPLFGLLASIPFFALYFATGQEVWAKGAAFIGFINLLNLAPIPPLDGSKALGPVLARVNPQLERVGMLLAGAAAIVFGILEGYFFLAVFVGIAVLGYLKRGAWRPEAQPMTWREAGGGLVLYVMALILCAGVMYYANHLFGGAYLEHTGIPIPGTGVEAA